MSFIAPMLATKGDRIPGAGWVHEIKWDGIRAIVVVTAGRVKVFTRSGRDISLAVPELAGLAEFGDFVLDGEIVSLQNGVPKLADIADRIHLTDAAKAARLATTNPVTILGFDLLQANGNDLTGLPWRQRREHLESLGLATEFAQIPQIFTDGDTLHQAAQAQGLEGIVSKQAESSYRPGARSKDWLKFPIRPAGSFVVGGWRYETDSSTRLGSLLLGQPTSSGLIYRGRVGSGLAGKVGQTLLPRLQQLAAPADPFTGLPSGEEVGTQWVRPELVVEVRYLQLTSKGHLRQPSYQGVRLDQQAAELINE